MSTIRGGSDTTGNVGSGAGGGGAIFSGAASSGLTDLESVTFLNDQSTNAGASFGGGAVLNLGGNLTVNNCVFGDGTNDNATAGVGGAIAYDSDGTAGTLTVSNSTFNLNQSGGVGGAIAISQSGGTATANISASAFTGNHDEGRQRATAASKSAEAAA